MSELMARTVRRPLTWLIALVLVCVAAVPASAEESPHATGDFPVAAGGAAATIWLDEDEPAPVARVVTDLRADVGRVTDLEPAISTADERPEGPVIVVGTLGQSAQIDALVASGDITEAEARAVQGQWEAYLVKVIDAQTMVIAGSDPRGVVYGTYNVSKQIGVNPWYFFADTHIEKRAEVLLPASTAITDKPDVQYRGIFLNDEEKLARWATQVFGDPSTMGPKTYAKIFELILRLGGNQIWAAMHVNSINNVPGNIDLVQEYGIVLGSSHPDMVLRTNIHEWNDWKKQYAAANGLNAADIQYDYTVSKDIVLQYWRESIERHEDTEAQWTLGMRGPHDEPFDVHNIMNSEYAHLGDTLEERKANIMNEIVGEQRGMLEEILGSKKFEESFQAFIPYKEVLPIYNHPDFDLPEDVTVIWPDDNHGFMRRLPDAEERQRPGGHGLYSHASYWAPADQSYMWLNSIPLALMGEELSKSWENNIRKSWILNIGDIKPQEVEMEFFLRYGWDVEDYENDSVQFLESWASSLFGDVHSKEVASILTTFYQHTNVRKLEHMRVGLFNLTDFRDEASRRMAVYQDIFDRTRAVRDALPEAQQLSFYELVQSKINWAYHVNKSWFYADKSNLAHDQGKLAAAETYLAASADADKEKKDEIAAYSTLAGGKWRGFIDPEVAAPPVISQLPAGTPVLVRGDPELGIVVQGEQRPKTESVLRFSPFGQDGKFIDVFNKGSGNVTWSATPSEPWVKLSDTSGTVHDETRLWVTIDDAEAQKGKEATVTITSEGAPGGPTSKSIEISVENPTTARADIDGFAEADGYVSIEAEHYSRHSDRGGATWQALRDLGRAFGGDVMRAYNPSRAAIAEAEIKVKAPSLEYDVHLTSSGSFPLEVYRVPTLNSAGKVRFAVSVDDGEPIVVESEAADEGQGTIWVSNIFQMVEKHVVDLPELDAGDHTITLWMVDDYIMVDKLVVYTSSEGVVPSYLGPEESYHPEHNPAFSPVAPELHRSSAPTEPKNIPATWGSGPFVEKAGAVHIEAEYAMENVLDSVDELTQDMSAFTISKKDVAESLDGMVANAWRLTQSDTGMAMRLPDHGGMVTKKEQFPVYSPELGYKIDFTTTGKYNVWVRWRFIDDASDSIRGGLNRSYAEKFSTASMFSHHTDEKWHWKNLGTVDVSKAGEQPFSLWMREDGLYIDRISLLTGSESPSEDGAWTVSTRSQTSPAQQVRDAVTEKRATMDRFSYPVGDATGTYSTAAYREISDAIDAAEAAAAEPELTQAEADDVLARIATAETALDDALKLEGDGVTYNAHRSFEFDQAGKVPYGIVVEDLTNGATALVTEEEGNTFLRLNTVATGKANLFLPYAGEVTASDGDQIVISYRARRNSEFGYANGAMVRNDSGTGNYSMVTAFDRGKLMVQNGSSRPQLDAIELGTWYEITMITDWESKEYSVLLDGVEVASGYDFRHVGGVNLTGQRFGIDGFANASIDFDDFRVQVRTEVSPEGPRAWAAVDGRMVSLTAAGDGVDVERIEYALGDAAWQVYEGPFTVEGTGSVSVSYRAVDSRGVAGPSSSVAVAATDPGAAAEIVGLGAAKTVLVGDPATGLGAIVTDGSGGLVLGASVTFTASGGAFAGGSSTAVVDTNAAGIAVAPAVSSTVPGQITLTAAFGQSTVDLPVVTVVAPSAALSAEVTASTKTVSGKVVIGVSAVNTSDETVSIKLATRYGTKNFEAVAPGSTVTAEFKTYLGAIPAGSVTTTVVGSSGTITITGDYSN